MPYPWTSHSVLGRWERRRGGKKTVQSRAGPREQRERGVSVGDGWGCTHFLCPHFPGVSLLSGLEGMRAEGSRAGGEALKA